MPSLANNKVPLTSRLSIFANSGARKASKFSKRTNLYNAQTVICDADIVCSPLNELERKTSAVETQTWVINILNLI